MHHSSDATRILLASAVVQPAVILTCYNGSFYLAITYFPLVKFIGDLCLARGFWTH